MAATFFNRMKGTGLIGTGIKVRETKQLEDAKSSAKVDPGGKQCSN
jgi:hypothetical protein